MKGHETQYSFLGSGPHLDDNNVLDLDPSSAVYNSYIAFFRNIESFSFFFRLVTFSKNKEVSNLQGKNILAHLIPLKFL